MSINLTRAFGGVGFLCTFMVGQQFVFSDFERLQRQALFDRTFMNFHFKEEHNKAIGDDPANMGLPDDGNGRYSKLKAYPEWYFMNIARRQKSNGHDSLVTMAPLSLVNGLFLPYVTMGLVSGYCVGRYLYVEGYIQKEGAANKQRTAGAILCHTTNCITMLTSLAIGVQLARGKLPHMLKRAAFEIK